MDGPIIVKSSGQRWQAITSTDSETHGLSQAMYEGIPVRGYAMESGIPINEPTLLESDNQGGVCIGRNATSMNRARATAMRAVFMQECVERGWFDLKHKPGVDMTADVLTKWLGRNQFEKHRAKLINIKGQRALLKALAIECPF